MVDGVSKYLRSKKQRSLILKCTEMLLDQSFDVRHCPHTEADPKRRLLFSREVIKRFTQEEFSLFLALTTMDQILHLADEQERREFKSEFSWLPIPVAEKGFGCVRVISPPELLEMWRLF